MPLRFESAPDGRTRWLGGDALRPNALGIDKLFPQTFQTVCLVAQLAALPPSHNNKAAWLVDEAHCRVGRVDRLAARTGSAKHVHVAFGKKCLIRFGNVVVGRKGTHSLIVIAPEGHSSAASRTHPYSSGPGSSQMTWEKPSSSSRKTSGHSSSHDPHPVHRSSLTVGFMAFLPGVGRRGHWSIPHPLESTRFIRSSNLLSRRAVVRFGLLGKAS